MNDPTPRKAERNLRLLVAVQFALVLLLVLALGLSLLSRRQDAAPGSPHPAVQPPASGPSSLDELAAASRRVVAKSGPSVAFVEVRREGDEPAGDDKLARLFGAASDRSIPPSQGSGVVVDASGYILTSAHVVRDAKQITVRLAGDQPASAALVGIDARTDLALLKIEGGNLTAVQWGESDELTPGDFVWAIGSPFGLQSSVSFGIVSATDRRLPSMPEVGLIQTDAAINPGSSGGPLVDGAGRVVGINTAILGRDHLGVGFAVPARVARQVFLKLLASKSAPPDSDSTPPAPQDASHADGLQ